MLNFFFPVCIEINECTVNPDICGAGHCINLPVGYTCICYEGYKLNDQQTKCFGMNGCFQNSEITMLWSAWNVELGVSSSTGCLQTMQKLGFVCQAKFASQSLIQPFSCSELNMNLIKMNEIFSHCKIRANVIRETISSLLYMGYLKSSDCWEEIHFCLEKEWLN